MPEMDPNYNVTDLRRKLAAARAELRQTIEDNAMACQSIGNENIRLQAELAEQIEESDRVDAAVHQASPCAHSVYEVLDDYVKIKAELDDAWHSIGDRTEGLDLATHIESLKAQKESQAERLAEARNDMERLLTPCPLSEYHEDHGSVLWHSMPICAPPYCGSPLDSDWPFVSESEKYLAWTPLPDCNAIQDRFDAGRKREEPQCPQS
jgi:hypothetical protein